MNSSVLRNGPWISGDFLNFCMGDGKKTETIPEGVEDRGKGDVEKEKHDDL